MQKVCPQQTFRILSTRRWYYGGSRKEIIIMGFKSDIEIAQECTMEPITKIAEKAGIDDKYLEQYGKYKAKIDYNLLKETEGKDGKLVLVTAINQLLPEKEKPPRP